MRLPLSLWLVSILLVVPISLKMMWKIELFASGFSSGYALKQSRRIENSVCLYNGIDKRENDKSVNGGMTKRKRVANNKKEWSKKGGDSEKRRKSRKNEKSDRRKEGPSSDTTVESGEGEVQRTLSGGPSLIFDMARRMMVWQEIHVFTDSSESTARKQPQQQQQQSPNVKPRVLPRWHPHGGVSDINPSFRLSSPVMNNRGYAGVLRRNSRKRNKPSLWRYALRSYDKMRTLEDQEQTAPNTNKKISIQRTTIHHTSALVACSKLGQWKEALRIYNELLAQQQTTNTSVEITEHMIHAIIRSCVRAAKLLFKQKSPHSHEPLDAARTILSSMTEKHNVLVTSVHVNPLAAAYFYIQMPEQANDLIDKYLHHPVGNADQYDHVNDALGTFHVEDIQARDLGTYNIQISHAISQSDWNTALDQLYNMNKVGLHPSKKQLNSWSELHHYN